ncbi:MAG TPA: hypothetical protein P5511_08670, partial [Candidatus Goldiibacteriota bacterium]|nr:hypothetical protein [Candidatus Goldiibacteriota bacterium]
MLSLLMISGNFPNFRNMYTPTRTPTVNLSWTRTRTPTVTPTWTASPIPPPTNKLNLEIMTNSNYDSCTNQTFSFYYRITNWETTTVSTSNISIKIWVDTTDAISGVIDSAAYYNPSGVYQSSMTGTVTEAAGAGCAGATKSANITMSTVNIPADGGYVVLQGRVIRGSYLSPFDAECNDYTQLRSTWTSYTNNNRQTLWQGTNLVCEYTNASTQDAATGLHPCSGANGCGAAGTATRTPSLTNTVLPPTVTFSRTPTGTFTRTNTPTFTRTTVI